jgi:hypothetical protein
MNRANADSAVLRVIRLAALALANARPRSVISYASASPLGQWSAGSTRSSVASSLRNTESLLLHQLSNRVQRWPERWCRTGTAGETSAP